MESKDRSYIDVHIPEEPYTQADADADLAALPVLEKLFTLFAPRFVTQMVGEEERRIQNRLSGEDLDIPDSQRIRLQSGRLIRVVPSPER